MPHRSFKKRLLKIVATILLAPYALTLIYWIVPPPSTLMLADIATLHLPKRDWVSLEDISPNLIAAVVASEDGAFCEHFGFDFAQMEKALDAAEDGRKLRGASTITQQTAKNLFLWNGRSWLRKLLEAPLTLWLEIVWSKKRILEVYLNIAEWDDGVYGAESAAQAQFGTSAKNLSLAQAALLASALPSPGHMRPAQAGVIAARAQNHGPDLSCLR